MLLEACAGERVPGLCRQVSVFAASLVSSAGMGEGALRVKGGIRREVPFRTFLPDGGHILLRTAMFLILARFPADGFASHWHHCWHRRHDRVPGRRRGTH